MPAYDDVLTRFLRYQHEQAMALSAASDLVDLVPVGPADVPAMYLVNYRCKGLIRRHGEVVEHDSFVVGIHIPEDYLCRFDTARVLTWCEPLDIRHPNIRPPYVCVGNMSPGTALADLVFQCFEIVSYVNVEMREHNALNREACSWARRNRHRFPVDRRPLKRRPPVPNPQPHED